MSEVEVVPHNPAWREVFEKEAVLIATAFGNNFVAIHHIGSTAIPNIYAKPVIDMLAEVKDIDAVDEQSEAMKQLGYEAKGEFGIPGRRYFRKDDSNGVRTHQIHTFESRSDQVTRHLAFRDYLIAHPDEAQEYSTLKRRLAREHSNNAVAYMDGKDVFIKDIDRRAAQWNT